MYNHRFTPLRNAFRSIPLTDERKRVVGFLVVFAATSLAMFFGDHGLDIFHEPLPLTEDRKGELLSTFSEETQQILRAPPECWGYKGPRRIIVADPSAEERRIELWIASIGREPALTCAEYENSN